MPVPCRPSEIKAPFLQNTAAQELDVVKSDIRELHARANELRVAIGQPLAADVEQVLGRYSSSGSSGDAASQALNKLRDQKAGELQILTLYECGRSVRDARAVALLGKDPPEASTRQFNLRALIATVEAVSEQHRQLQEAERRQEAVQAEKAALQAEIEALKEESELFRTALLTKPRPASAGAARAAPLPPRRPQSAPHRPAAAAAAGPPAAPPTPTTQPTVVPAGAPRHGVTRSLSLTLTLTVALIRTFALTLRPHPHPHPHPRPYPNQPHKQGRRRRRKRASPWRTAARRCSTDRALPRSGQG